MREYFDSDSPTMSMSRNDIEVGAGDQRFGHVTLKLAPNFDAGVRYWYIFLPKVAYPIDAARLIFATPEVYEGFLTFSGVTGVDFAFAYRTGGKSISVKSLLFSRRINLYVDQELTDDQKSQIVEFGRKRRLKVEIRDSNYAKNRSKMETPVAFISHDSRDKNELVRDLAVALRSMGCPVWYDEFSLSIGDNLRESIERGLREVQKCILVLSPNYLSNTGWGAREFDAVFTRELIERQNVILPVWHNVEAKDVYDYSPNLANRFALMSSIGVDELARELSKKVSIGDFYPRHLAE